MIAAAWAATRLWFTSLPSGARKAAYAAALAIACAFLIWLWFRAHDANVIERHEMQRESASNAAAVKSADERVVDAFENQRLRDQRDQAIAKAEQAEAAKPVEARSTLSAQDTALNCARLRQAGLTGGARYKEMCR